MPDVFAVFLLKFRHAERVVRGHFGVRGRLFRVKRLVRLVGFELGDGGLDVRDAGPFERGDDVGRHLVDVGVGAEVLHRLRELHVLLERVLRVGHGRGALVELLVVEAPLDPGLDGRLPVARKLVADLGLDGFELGAGGLRVVGGLEHVHLEAGAVEAGRLVGAELLVERLALLDERQGREADLDEAADRAGDHAGDGGVALGVGLVDDAVLDRLALGLAHLAVGVALLLGDFDEKRHQLVEVEHRVLRSARLGVAGGGRLGELLEGARKRFVELRDLLVREVEARIGGEFRAERVDRRLVHLAGDFEIVRDADRDGRLHAVRARRDRDVRRARGAVGALGLGHFANFAEQRLPIDRARVSVDLEAHFKTPCSCRLPSFDL